MGVPQKTSPIIKLVIALAVLLFVAGALVVGGIFYAAHRVSQKIHAATARLAAASGDSGFSGSSTGAASVGDACRLLSKEDVSQAIGVTITRTESPAGGCSYFAQGTQSDMTARHMSAMMASNGATTQQQKQMQAITGGLFKSLQAENKEGNNNSSDDVVVFSFSVDKNAAHEQMQLNKGVMAGVLGGQRIPDLGVDAFQVGSSAIMFRKGDNMVRIMYMTCPCGTEAVKPLAKKIADAL